MSRGIALCWCSESEWFQIYLFDQTSQGSVVKGRVGGLMSWVEHGIYVGSLVFLSILDQTRGTSLNTRTFCAMGEGKVEMGVAWLAIGTAVSWSASWSFFLGQKKTKYYFTSHYSIHYCNNHQSTHFHKRCRPRMDKHSMWVEDGHRNSIAMDDSRELGVNLGYADCTLHHKSCQW